MCARAGAVHAGEVHTGGVHAGVVSTLGKGGGNSEGRPRSGATLGARGPAGRPGAGGPADLGGPSRGRCQPDAPGRHCTGAEALPGRSGTSGGARAGIRAWFVLRARTCVAAMLPLLRRVPRALGSAVAGLRAAPALPPPTLLRPAPRPCVRPFGLLPVRAGLLRSRGPCGCGCGCGGLHTQGEAGARRGRWSGEPRPGGRGPKAPNSRPPAVDDSRLIPRGLRFPALIPRVVAPWLAVMLLNPGSRLYPEPRRWIRGGGWSELKAGEVVCGLGRVTGIAWLRCEMR